MEDVSQVPKYGLMTAKSENLPVQGFIRTFSQWETNHSVGNLNGGNAICLVAGACPWETMKKLKCILSPICQVH